LIVNHLGEAIEHLAKGDRGAEMHLWGLLRNEIQSYRIETRLEGAECLIENLIHGPTLPAKGNMITRFQRTPDIRASYVGIPNPLAL
jgi:siderophore synthetase component